MDKLWDQEYLLNEQYRDASKLNARYRLHQDFSTNPQPWLRWVFDHYDFADQCRVLELGCGPGRLWLENRERLPAGWQLTLADFSPGMLAEAQKNLRDHGDRITFEQIDAQEIPFAEGSFDQLVANHMLYHVPDRDRAIGEMVRVLKPGGRLFAGTNGKVEGPTIGDWAAKAKVLAGGPAPETRSQPAEPIFSLECGGPQLERHFAQVEMHRYEDAYAITEVQPLIDYVQSSSRMALDEAGQAALRRLVGAEIEREGALRIAKSAGIFIATKTT